MNKLSTRSLLLVIPSLIFIGCSKQNNDAEIALAHKQLSNIGQGIRSDGYRLGGRLRGILESGSFENDRGANSKGHGTDCYRGLR